MKTPTHRLLTSVSSHKSALRYPQSQTAFTLLELLVAMSVLSILMGILFMIFNESTRAWGQTQRRVEAFREARAALHTMTRDLQNAYVTKQTPMLLQQQISNLSAEPGPFLFFVTSQSFDGQDTTNRSDLCTVGYYCAYMPNRDNLRAGMPRSYKLFRYFKQGNVTYGNIVRTATAANALTDFYTFGTGSGQLAAPSPLQSGDEVLAFNVCNLKVRYVTQQNTTMTDVVPATFPKLFAAATATTAEVWDYPVQLEVSVDAFNFDTAAKFYVNGNDSSARQNWNGTSTKVTKLRQESVQTFTTRITLPVPSS